jgi:hypothetical protein
MGSGLWIGLAARPGSWHAVAAKDPATHSPSRCLSHESRGGWLIGDAPPHARDREQSRSGQRDGDGVHRRAVVSGGGGHASQPWRLDHRGRGGLVAVDP